MVRLSKPFLFACIFTFGSFSKAHADSRSEIKKKLAKAVSLSNAVTEVENRYGKYAESRKQYTGSVNAIAKKVQAWQESTLGWTSAWFEVFAWADIEEPVEFSKFEEKLNALVEEQHRAYEKLENEASELKQRVHQIRKLLDHGAFPGKTSDLRVYKPVYESFEKIQKEIGGQIAQVSGILKRRTEEIRKVNRLSTKVVLGHLRKALIDHHAYPVRESMSRIQALLKERDLMDPIVSQIEAAEMAASEAALSLHLFELESLSQSSRKTCADARKKIANLGGDGSQVQAGRERVDTLCEAIQEHHQSLATLGFEASDLVSEMLNVEKVDLQSLCVDSESPAQECEKLAVLAALNRDEIDAMPRAELRFVELEWTKNLKEARERSK